MRFTSPTARSLCQEAKAGLSRSFPCSSYVEKVRKGGVRTQPEAARPEQHVDGDPDRIHQGWAEDPHAGRGPHPPAHAHLDIRHHRVIAGLGQLQALGVAAPDHEERSSGRVVVLDRRVAGEDLAPVAARGIPGLVEREPVAVGRGVRAQDLPDAEGWLVGPTVSKQRNWLDNAVVLQL